jgi:CBS-domain-containing membrane protein
MTPRARLKRSPAIGEDAHLSSRQGGPTEELEAAMEILGEIFGIRRSEVEEMIRQRLEDRPIYDLEFSLG